VSKGEKVPKKNFTADFKAEKSVDKPTTVQQGGVGLGYVRVQAKGKQDRRRVTGKTDT